MEQIRAFIAHSFAKDDADVVNRFLKYFTQLSRTLPTFSWEHAEAAEPKVLAEKVMTILDGKNVFVAICTRKERVIENDALRKSFFLQGFFKVREDAFCWKTSDWIIQEIGLARGRKLDLILLIETGVRDPGGLQGDLEYISFDRAEPEKCFGKILEMIAALSPKSPNRLEIATNTKSGVDVEQEELKPPIEDYFRTPQPDWKRNMYEIALRLMVANDDKEGIKTINNSYLNSDDAACRDNATSWEAFNESIHLTFGKGGSLSRLKTFVSNNSDNSLIIMGTSKNSDLREFVRV
jgi:hypothetical protein